MINKPDFQKFLPFIIAVLTFFFVTFVYFNPVFLTNKQLEQHDILQSQGGAKEIRDFREVSGKEPLWTNSMFGGMPSYLITTEFPFDVLSLLQKAYGLFLPHPAHMVFSAMFSFFILLLAFNVRPGLALAGGIAFGLSTFMLISLDAGHNSKVWAIAYMPIIIGGIRLTFHKNILLGLALTTLGMGLELRASHLQITYYLFLMVVIYGISELIYFYKIKKLHVFFKRILLLIVAVTIAIGANFGRLWTVYEYGQFSIRGKSELTSQNRSEDLEGGLDKDYAFRWSMGKAETFTLLIPNFMGGATTEDVGNDSNFGKALAKKGLQPVQIKQASQNAYTYWGDQPFTAGPVYLGAIIIFLFVIGLFTTSKNSKAWLILVTVLSILLAWGNNLEWFNYFIFDYLPGYNKFRSVTMTLSLALISVPLLGFIGLEKLIKEKNKVNSKKNLIYSLLVAGGVCLLFVIFAGIGSYRSGIDERLLQSGYPEWFIDALRNQRMSMLRMDALRSLIYVLLSGSLLYLFIVNKLKILPLTIGISILIFFDVFMVGKRYLNSDDLVSDPTRLFFATTEAEKYVLGEDEDVFRVVNLLNPWNDARISYHFHSIGGYHGAKIRRYQDLINNCLDTEIQESINILQKGSKKFDDLYVLNMMNTRYLFAGENKQSVIKNNAAFGNAWLIEDLVPVSSPDEELIALCELQRKDQAVIDTSQFAIKTFKYSNKGSIKLDQYEPGKIKYLYDSETPSFAVFSEIYYEKGWRATLDDNFINIKRVNYILRGVELPAGNHEIEFSFEPVSYATGSTISVIFSILLILGVIGGFLFSLFDISKISNP